MNLANNIFAPLDGIESIYNILRETQFNQLSYCYIFIPPRLTYLLNSRFT